MSIKAGDMVMVFRWPHDCVNESRVPGTPFIVSKIEPLEGICRQCSRPYEVEGSLGARGLTGHGRIPLSWLKKIDPKTELDDVKNDVEITA